MFCALFTAQPETLAHVQDQSKSVQNLLCDDHDGDHDSYNDNDNDKDSDNEDDTHNDSDNEREIFWRGCSYHRTAGWRHYCPQNSSNDCAPTGIIGSGLHSLPTTLMQ